MKFIAKFNVQQLMLYYFTHDFHPTATNFHDHLLTKT